MGEWFTRHEFLSFSFLTLGRHMCVCLCPYPNLNLPLHSSPSSCVSADLSNYLWYPSVYSVLSTLLLARDYSRVDTQLQGHVFNNWPWCKFWMIDNNLPFCRAAIVDGVVHVKTEHRVYYGIMKRNKYMIFNKPCILILSWQPGRNVFNHDISKTKFWTIFLH